VLTLPATAMRTHVIPEFLGAKAPCRSRARPCWIRGVETTSDLMSARVKLG
jgi:hypothetical protein